MVGLLPRLIRYDLPEGINLEISHGPAPDPDVAADPVSRAPFARYIRTVPSRDPGLNSKS